MSHHYSGTCNSFALVHYFSSHSPLTLMHLPQLGIKFKNSLTVEGGPLHSHLFMNGLFCFLLVGELAASQVLLEWPKQRAVAGCDPSAWWCNTTQQLVQLFVIGNCESSALATLLGPSKEYWWGQWFRSGEEVEVAVQEYLLLQDPRFLPWWKF